MMTRRTVLATFAAGLAGAVLTAKRSLAAAIEKLVLSDAEWKQRLTEEQYYVLREEGTERAYTSPLNDEKRAGSFHCAGCDLELFTSEMKYDSGTGWPSFFEVIEGHVETKLDFYLVYPRREYHCARCGGHHGHVFEDGPQPTGLRYCNNGVALTFKPKQADKPDNDQTGSLGHNEASDT